MSRSPRSQHRQNEALYPVKVAAGWISVVSVCGMLGVAIDRGPNQAYIAMVTTVTVAVVIGLVVFMRRHARHIRRNEHGSTR